MVNINKKSPVSKAPTIVRARQPGTIHNYAVFFCSFSLTSILPSSKILTASRISKSFSFTFSTPFHGNCHHASYQRKTSAAPNLPLGKLEKKPLYAPDLHMPIHAFGSISHVSHPHVSKANGSSSDLSDNPSSPHRLSKAIQHQPQEFPQALPPAFP